MLRTATIADTSRSGASSLFPRGKCPSALALDEAAGGLRSVIAGTPQFRQEAGIPGGNAAGESGDSGLVTEVFALLIFWLPTAGARTAPAHRSLAARADLIPQLLFTAGLCWFLAALGVFLRDLGQIMGFVLTLWFFLTPICYPENKLPHVAAGVLTKNPIYVLVHGYRSIFLQNHAPAFGALWKFSLVAILVFLLGHAWFYKLRKSFPDLL